MRKYLILLVLALSLSLMSFANAVTYAGSSGPFSGTVTFSLTGNNLTIDLSNTSASGAMTQFDWRGPQLTFVSVSRSSFSTYHFGPVDSSRTQDVTGSLAAGMSVILDLTTPAGFNLGMVGNNVTNDGPRSYSVTSWKMRIFNQLQSPSVSRYSVVES